MFKRYAAVLLVACVLSGLGGLGAAAPASAVTAAPGWEIFTRVAPTNLPPGGEGLVTLIVYNVGAAAGEHPVVTDTLPAGVLPTKAEAIAGTVEGGTLGAGGGESSAGECVVEGQVVTCTVGRVSVGGVLKVKIYVGVESGVAQGSEVVNRATVVGGGALGPANESKTITLSSAPAGFGFAGLDAWFTNADGTSATQAGSHPYEVTIVYDAQQ